MKPNRDLGKSGADIMASVSAEPRDQREGAMRDAFRRYFEDRASDARDIIDASARDGVVMSYTQAVLLAALLEDPGRSVSRDRLSSLVEAVGKLDEVTYSSMISHMKRLRRKLRRLGWPVEIETAREYGYRATGHIP